ncbi:unnamed protein product, partial [Iphiclides podalirius]
MGERLIKRFEVKLGAVLRQAHKESGGAPALGSSSTDFCTSQGFANRASLLQDIANFVERSQGCAPGRAGRACLSSAGNFCARACVNPNTFNK